MYGTLQLGQIFFLIYNLNLSWNFMHNFDSLKKDKINKFAYVWNNMHYVVNFFFLNCSKIIQPDCGKHISEISWWFKEFV